MNAILSSSEHDRKAAHAPGAKPSLTRSQKIAMTAATLGTVVEYTDWLIYATFASLFSPHFFPAKDPAVSLLSTFAVFAVGFIMRPVGGAVLGSFCDRYGRKKALALSVTLMACSSLAIAVCPGYESIGIGASLVLVVARLVQGFSAGGEFGAGSTFLVETAPDDRRGLAGSLQHAAVNSGVLVASFIGFVLTSLLAPDEMAAWGWRAGFAVAGALGLVVLWLRMVTKETDAFIRVKETQGHERRTPFADIFKKHPKAALRVVGIAMAGNLLNYLWLVHFPTYVHLKTGLSLKDALSVSMISVAVSLVLVPLFGALSDRIGRRPLLMGFAAGSALFIGPGLALLSDNFWVDTAIVTTGMVFVSMFSGVIAAVLVEQFPAEVRATGVSFPYAVAVTLFGGTAPWVVTTMTAHGIGNFVWVYVAAVCAIGFAVYATMPETHKKSLS